MKNILILICFLATNLFSQTNEPTARTFEWNGKTQTINPNDHIQRSFIRGFEMGQFKSFDDLLNCNSHFGSQFDKDVENNPGREYQPLLKFNHLTNHKNHELLYDPNPTNPKYYGGYNPYGPGRTWVGRDISLEGVAAIEWEPVLEVNESNWDDVFDDPYNSDNFVFGFSEVSSFLFSGGRIH